MRPTVILALGLFGLYALWASALQGLLAAPASLGEWTPELALVLLFAWAGRLRDGRGPVAALLAGLARAAFGAASPAACLATSLGAYGLFAGLQRALVVDRALPRAALCGLGAWLGGWLFLATRDVALAAAAPGVEVEGVRLWPGALASALACVVLAPLLTRLPGLAPLGRSPR